MQTNTELNKWLQEWLERSEIYTRRGLAKELNCHHSLPSHWVGKMNSIPEDRLKQIDEIYPARLKAYFELQGLPFDEERWLADE